MRWKKSTAGMEILGTKDSDHHHIYHEVVVPPRKLGYKRGSSEQSNASLSVSLCLSDCEQFKTLAILSAGKPISNTEPILSRLSEMEHFNDLEEQTSISVDQNEIPISDSEDDSISSSVFEEFGIFKSIGLTKIEEGNQCYEMVNGFLAYGMGKDSNVAAIHKVPWSGPNGRGRLEAFHVSSAEMVKNRGGDGNVKCAWYGGSRDEICRIISNGFQRCRQSDNEDGFGLYLYPLEFVMDGLLSSIVDEYGLRHVLLCSVVLGQMEEVRTNSRQFHPSSNDFDSGVDNLSKPTRLIIWEAYMNSRVFPCYVVSFGPPNRGKRPKY
ncbi:hypothetical protein Vadar_023195 [Vaccinium darrowii]|uniref:Uncharacterized protein n=1 Tax=Vaccinium darrowii TaxID=229202 RepID=A0ACB7YXQ4_9ERIC|nr:hypothetical protein Vadar_023195 [Vaccinium darrowii]